MYPSRERDAARGLSSGHPHEARLDAEDVAHPVRREDLLRRPVPDDPAPVQEHEAGEEVGGQRQVVEDGEDGRPVALVRSTSSSMTSTWWRRSRWTVGSSRSRTGAAWATASATRTSWRSPSDSSRASRPRRSPSPTRSIAAATAALSAGRWPRNGSSWGSRPRPTTSSTVGRERQRHLLGHDGQAPGDRDPVEPLDRIAAELDAAGDRGEDAGRDAEERRLAGPVRADEGDALTGPDRQVDPGQRGPTRSQRSAPRSGSQLVTGPRPPQQEQEERGADDRRDDADRDLAEEPGGEVGEDHEAAPRRGR